MAVGHTANHSTQLMSIAISTNWKTEEQIQQEEFEEGYEQEAVSGTLRPTERNDGSDNEIEYNQMEGTVGETTMYADRGTDKYNPNKSLPQCEEYPTKGAKFNRLWKLNAGRDDHTVAGKTYKDEEIHKVDQHARDRARFVHGVAIEVGLPESMIERCTSIARRLDTRAFNYWGGMDVFLLAIVKYVAEENNWSIDTDAFHEIREHWEVGRDDLSSAVEKVEEKLEPN